MHFTPTSRMARFSSTKIFSMKYSLPALILIPAVKLDLCSSWFFWSVSLEKWHFFTICQGQINIPDFECLSGQRFSIATRPILTLFHQTFWTFSEKFISYFSGKKGFLSKGDTEKKFLHKSKSWVIELMTNFSSNLRALSIKWAWTCQTSRFFSSKVIFW